MIMRGNAAGTAPGETHGFTSALTSFVGREAESDKVAALLDEYRLVTVTGPGGVGKTRLATEVASQAAGRFADGAWLVELGPVTDSALVPSAVATTLGIQQATGQSATDLVTAALARQQVLLVLDNCEHVLGAVAELCGALLMAADDLTVLATSREPVGVAGETRYRLRPLPVPAVPSGPAAADWAAVTLFADRARQADPDFALDGQTAPTVARLVTRLDGMPLAIELAAARIESLGLGQLLDRLEVSFGLLAEGGRTAPPRQQSLAATAQWSYQLLAEADQQVFRRLAVFPGGFTLDGAEVVGGPDAAAVVLHLVDCSLLTPPRTGPDGRSRYLMLQALREFGLARLAEAGEQASADAALTDYAQQVARQAATGLRTGAGEVAAARWLDTEDATVHQALSWALEHDSRAALLLAIALSAWWQRRGRLATGYALLTAAAQAAEPGSEAWCEAQFCLGRAAVNCGDIAAGLGHLNAVRACAGPSVVLADALTGRALCLGNLGQLDEAVGQSLEALALAREIGYPAGQVKALLTLQFQALRADDRAAVLRWRRQAEDVDWTAIPGDLARGWNVFLTGFLLETGDLAGAQQSCAEGLTRAREAGDLLSEAEFSLLGARLGVESGRLVEAGPPLRDAIALATLINDQMTLIECLTIAGRICAADNRWAEAVTLWTAFAAARDRAGLVGEPSEAQSREELLRQAARSLGPARMRAAEERGTALTLQAAAELAIIVTNPDAQSAAARDDRSRLGALSARERELVALVAQGQTDAQIAGRLFISISTVRSHLDRIRDKTSCRRRADLTRLALQVGLA
jgi:predicted ATPase/DNA-binding CsgD family transcriptional regulator